MGRIKKYAWAFFGLAAIFFVTRGVTGFLGAEHRPNPTSRQALGPIYDAENRLLAESKKVQRFLLIPQAFKPTEENIELLARITGKKPSELALFLSHQKEPVLLPRANPKLLARLEGLPGIIRREYYVRRYPFGKLWPLLDGTQETLSGLEAYYRTILLQPRTSLNLGIKIELQRALERDVEQLLKRFKAKAGGGIILDISTGRVTAISTLGEKDLLLKDELPLSVLKAPLEEAYYESMYEDWEDFLRALGFGERTRIDLPGEEVGVLPVEIAGLEEALASPVQMVRALAALVSGRLVTPKIAMGVHSGKETYRLPPSQTELEDLIPREKGGVWSWGGTKKEGVFLVGGLWPLSKPEVAYVLYLKGVNVQGLPPRYARFVPKTLKAGKVDLVDLAKDRKKGKKVPQAVSKGAAKVMPDVRGLTLKEILARLVPLGLKVKFSGFGVAVQQWPAPGAPLKKYKECRVVLK